MSATVIHLKRQSKPPLANIRSDTVEQMLAADPADAFFDGTRVRLLLEGLHAQQDTLLSIIDSLRTPSLQAHPNLGRPAADLEATSTQALAEVGLLIRRGSALLRRHEKHKPERADLEERVGAGLPCGSDQAELPRHRVRRCEGVSFVGRDADEHSPFDRTDSASQPVAVAYSTRSNGELTSAEQR